MNIFDRIVNMLLEARVEMFIQDRLDEIAKITPKSQKSQPRQIMKMPKEQPKSKISQALKRWKV